MKLAAGVMPAPELLASGIAVGISTDGPADIMAVDTMAAPATPMYNVYAELVYALRASDVRASIIDGRLVMEDGKILTLDERAVLAKSASFKQQVWPYFAH